MREWLSSKASFVEPYHANNAAVEESWISDSGSCLHKGHRGSSIGTLGPMCFLVGRLLVVPCMGWGLAQVVPICTT